MFAKCLLSVICIIIFHSGISAAETLRIGIKIASIRESCRFLSPIKLSAKYNDEVDVILRQGDWYKVRFRGTEGCIHKSSIQTEKIELKEAASAEKHSASETEVALAGKGFTPEIEKEYQAQNPEIRLDLVNAVELYTVNPLDLQDFLLKGGLRLPE